MTRRRKIITEMERLSSRQPSWQSVISVHGYGDDINGDLQQAFKNHSRSTTRVTNSFSRVKASECYAFVAIRTKAMEQIRSNFRRKGNAFKVKSFMYLEHFEVVAETSYPDLRCSSIHSTLNASPDFEQARRWLQTCFLEHPECRGLQTGRRLPTRLVNVRQDKATAKLTANICRGATLPITTPYLSLSHCWGTVKFVTTSRNNLAQFEIELPVESLSRTVQDAMQITVELQMKYIWIDSLCIVQDDVNDWKSEASQMGEVYQNASCNISASAVANGEQGFILPRSFDPTPVTGEIKLLSTNKAIAWGPLANTYCFALSNPADELSTSPLFTRAWTLQEQVLASQALHFGKDQMFWECSRTFANEVWPQGWDNAMFSKAVMERFPYEISWQFSFEQVQRHKVGTGNAGTAKSHDNQASSYQTWYKFVMNYSRRYVTFQSDWLPALSGLASRFASPLEDKYVYGLWKKDLLRGLLFNQLGAKFAPRASIVRPNWSDIPSWSWAALYKPVIWYHDPLAAQVRELCKFELLDRQPTPILQLTGMLLSVASDDFKSMYLWNAAKHPKGSKRDGLEITVQFDQWFFANFEDRWIDCTDADIEDARKRGLNECRAAVLFMPVHLYQNQESHREAKRCRRVKGLLLCTQPDLEHGKYRRAGVCDVEVTADEDIDEEEIMDELRAYGQLHVSPAVHETLDDGQYVVSVV